MKDSSSSSKTQKLDNHDSNRQKDAVFILGDSMIKKVFCLQGI